MLLTALEIVAKKLVDILGDKAAKVGDRDKTRAASYKAYYALKRIEETFAEIADSLEHPPWAWSSEKSEREFGKINDQTNEQTIVATIKLLAPKYNLLAKQLGMLKEAFRDMEGKLEIYGSIEKAQSVGLYMGADDDVLRALFGYGKVPDNIRDVASNMVAASREARDTIASFIRENYEIGEREDGT